MMIFEGKSVCGGIAIGTIETYVKHDKKVVRVHVEDGAGEKQRFYDAKEKAKQQLAKLYEKALKEVGETNAEIFEVHQMMLDDLDYVNSVEHMIESQNVNAEYAVALTGDNFAQMFEAMDNDYMKERASDVKDISNRVIGILEGASAGKMSGEEPVILLADDLAPSETVQLDKSKILSFVTKYGSTNSHTAILARTMNIPALIAVEFSGELQGKMAIVDGYTGKVYVDPDEETLKIYQEKKQEDDHKKELILQLKGKENITLDGTKINLYANVGNITDISSALDNDAGGIGLFRSEFLYLEAEDYPSEEDLFKTYKAAAETMAGKKVIIRTLDIGADKQADYFQLEKEENPALGLRGIRLCLTRKEMFKTQLRAIYRASYYGIISIMYPMIISVEEVLEIKELIKEVQEELTAQKIAYGQVEQGIMIETPAAAIVSDDLAKEVDFFSIGTNDLSQYTLAIDRQNTNLDHFFQPHHKALLRLLEMVVKNGHKEGCWVGICGELAADTTLTEWFLKTGFDELSVSPPMVLKVREKIRELNLQQ